MKNSSMVWRLLVGFPLFMICAELIRQGFLRIPDLDSSKIFGVFLVSVGMQMSYFVNEFIFPDNWNKGRKQK